MSRTVSPTPDPSRKCLALAGGWVLLVALLVVSAVILVLPLLVRFDALAVP